MSGYQRINFKDQNVERPKTYDVTNNPDGSITLIESFGNIEELGTPINQENMKHIEDGIDAVSFSKFSLDLTYKKDDLITDIQNDELKIFRSLKDNNYGHLPSESEYWEEVEIAGSSGFNLFDTKLSDHILTYEESKGWALQGTYVYKTAIAGERYGYPTFIETCINEKNAGTAKQVTLGSNTLTMYVNDNGHQYYDIADKSKVDAFFNTFGIADFYGVDEENECVFLPRNNYFTRLTTDAKYVNSHQDYGLPALTTSSNGEHTHTRGTMNITGSFDGQVAFSTATGAFSLSNQSAGPSGGNLSGHHAITFNAGDSWTGATSSNGAHTHTIEGTADTVQPRSSLKLLYYCVGNTTTDTSWVDVVTQVEEGVKDLEDKTLEGIERLKASSTALTETQITNCITEIPQNIKLELADGTLTLKAGSVVTIPNGFEADGVTPKFDYVTIESDISENNIATTVAIRYLFVDMGSMLLGDSTIGYTNSGDTAKMNSISPANYAYFYNSEENKMYKGNGSNWVVYNFTLPIALIQHDSTGKPTSIDQVFNGMGYIGSTVWVDKGVKGLIPNGRNEDGSLKNIEYITDKLIMLQLPSNASGTINLQLNNNGAIGFSFDYIEQNSIPSNATIGTAWLNTAENKFYKWISSTTSWDEALTPNLFIFGNCNVTNGVISNFQQKQAFRALDYNDKPEISGWAMPSNKYIDLTLGASTSTYIAPANGWFLFSRRTNAANQYIALGTSQGGQQRIKVYQPSSGQTIECFLPIKKGQSVYIIYNGTISTSEALYFRFIYAQGEV